MFKKRTRKQPAQPKKSINFDDGSDSDSGGLVVLPKSQADENSKAAPVSGGVDTASNTASNTGLFEMSKGDEDKAALEIVKEKKSEVAKISTLRNEVYQGQKSYNKFAAKVTKPKLMKQPTNVTATTVVDYQRDICKDFFDHGYCGYGDTCKFLHVRGEFKKKEVKKDWEEVENKAKSSRSDSVEKPKKKKAVKKVLV